MTQKPIAPTHMLIFAAAFALGGALASAALAEPRVLTLPDRTEATLPGGASGITVNRGSGFPAPVVAEPAAPEQVTETPPEAGRIALRRSRNRY